MIKRVQEDLELNDHFNFYQIYLKKELDVFTGLEYKIEIRFISSSIDLNSLVLVPVN